MTIYYIIYKTTNLITNKIYIGAHATNDMYDDYYGSGKHLKRSMQKYGVENFTKEILHVFDNSEEMYRAEAFYVNEEFILDPNTYNIKIGGRGGWDHVNNKPMDEETKIKISNSSKGRVFTEEHKQKLRKPKSEETKERMRKPKSEAHIEKMRRPCSEETKQKLSIANKGKILSEEHKKKMSDANKGKRASVETKQKMSDAAKGRVFTEEHKKKLSGENNANFGKFWITDGVNNMLLKIDDIIPEDWYAGMIRSEETKLNISLGLRGEKHHAFGKIWINNGHNNKLILKDSIIPVGWNIGMVIKKMA